MSANSSMPPPTECSTSRTWHQSHANLTETSPTDSITIFWASIGGPAYTKTKPLITSLWNKHRLSLEQHGVPDAEHIAWLLTASTAMQIATYLLDTTIKRVAADHHLPIKIANDMFRQFSVEPMLKAWGRALLLLEPMEYKLEPLEDRNIQMGIDQLAEAWTEPSLLYDSVLVSCEDYDEVFRTKGFQKKAIREIAEVKQSIYE